MKTIYLLFTILFIGVIAFAMPYEIKIVLSKLVITEKKPTEKRKPIFPQKKVLKASQSKSYLLKENQSTENLMTLLVPTITATKSVTVQGGGNPVPGSQLNYQIVVNNAGTDATAVVLTDVLVADLTLVAGSVKATPIATDDSYSCIGNVGINVPAASGVLANDANPVNTSMTTTAVNTAGTQGTVTLNPDGSFTFTPNVGYSGTTTFGYTISNGQFTSTATVTITVSAPIWFVNIAAASNGNGSLASPFKDWSDFATANALTGATDPAANQTIFVYSGTYSGAATLKSGQKVLGRGATTTLASFAGVTVPTFSNTLPTTSGTKPNLTSSGTTITLSTGSHTLRGFDMGNSTSDIANGTFFGTLTTSEMALNGNGQALDLQTGALSATFTSISSTNSAAEGISLSSVSGTLTSTGGTTITNPTTFGIGFYSTISLNANFGNTNITGSGNEGFVVTGATNDNAIITFGDLDIAPDAGKGAINYFGSGSLTCTSGTITTSNTLGTIGGIAIAGGSSAQKATLAMVLDSYSNTGNASTNHGMTINNTLGSFTINGTGTTAGSGGTISNCTRRGANISNASNITLKNMNFINANITAGASSATDYSTANGAIVLNNVSGVTLTKIAISGTTKERGITGKTISNFTLNGGSTITDCGDEVNEGCLYLQELTGTCNINDATLSKGAENIARVFNSAGNLTLNIGTDATTTIFNDTQAQNANMTTPGAISAIRSYCFIYSGAGTATATLNTRNASFLKAGTHGFKVISDGTGTVNANIKSCTFDNENATFAPNDQGGSIDMVSFNTANLNYNILNNSCRGRDIAIINIVAQVNSNAQGRVNNNTVTHYRSGSAGDGIRFSAETDSDIITEVSGNNVSGMAAGVGILAISSGGTGKVNATITNNTITVTDALASHNIQIQAGNSSSTFSNTTCANVANNTTTRPDLVNGFNYRVRAVTTGTHKLYLQGTGATSAADVWASNSNTPSASANVAQSGTFGTHVFSSSNASPASLATCLTVNNPVYNSIAQASVEEIIEKPTEENTVAIDNKEISNTENDNIETDTIKTEETPSSTESIKANPNAASRKMAGETITVNGSGSGFTLPAGKSTTITFSATVSSTPSTCAITNQASVSGSNFTTVNSNTTTTNLVVAAPTAVTPSSATSICTGNSLNLTATCPNGSVNWYTVAAPSTLLGNSASGANFSQSPTVNTTYQAVCLVGGCESTKVSTGLITVNPLPTITVSPSPAICAGVTSFTIPYTGTTGTPTTYSISGTGITTVTNATLPASTITVNISDVGGATASSYAYTLTVRNANGCVSSNVTGSVTVNSTSAPTSPTATPSNFTVAGTTTLTATGCSSPASITWFDASNPTVALPNNTPTISANKTFFARCTGTNTCVSSPSANVSVTYTPCTPLSTSPGNVNITWTGLLSTDWNNACNWDPAWVPDATNGTVIIPNTLPDSNQTGTISVRSVSSRKSIGHCI
ncbi:MAG: Ig-like domain-containing protein [Arcicella sp.]|nr:Ig-like domain-containing protein [Arcicella sp.]